jgi:hypothetical protein
MYKEAIKLNITIVPLLTWILRRRALYKVKIYTRKEKANYEAKSSE